MFEACCHAMLSGVAGLPRSEIKVADGAIEAERAMAILRKACAARLSPPRSGPKLPSTHSAPEPTSSS